MEAGRCLLVAWAVFSQAAGSFVPRRHQFVQTDCFCVWTCNRKQTNAELRTTAISSTILITSVRSQQWPALCPSWRWLCVDPQHWRLYTYRGSRQNHCGGCGIGLQRNQTTANLDSGKRAVATTARHRLWKRRRQLYPQFSAWFEAQGVLDHRTNA